MPKTVVYDTLDLEGADVRVDLASGEIRVRVRYNLTASNGGPALAKEAEAARLLAPADRTFILDLVRRLKMALEALELA